MNPGERVGALGRHIASDPLTAERIEAAACRERLAGLKTPRTIVIQTEPSLHAPTGKVQKFLLVDCFSRAS